MRLLLDHNLSPRLVSRLQDLYPESVHVASVGLSTARDQEVWEYARDNELILVSKDADFSEMSILLGSPPKVIWLTVGNCSTAQVEAILRSNFTAAEELVNDTTLSILRIS